MGPGDTQLQSRGGKHEIAKVRCQSAAVSIRNESTEAGGRLPGTDEAWTGRVRSGFRDEVHDRERKDDSAENAEDQRKRGHHAGHALVFVFNVPGCKHHCETAEVATGQRHQNEGGAVDVVVREENRKRALLGKRVAEHEERDEEDSQQDRQP